MILGGIACVVVSLIPAGTERTDFIVGRVIGGMLGKGFITVSYDAVIVWSTELFPTIVRNSGIAIVYVAACLGSAAAPFVLELDRINPILPFGLMGGLAIVAALLGLLLPETRGRPTAEVFESKNSEKATEMNNLKGNIEDQNEKDLLMI
ncbi:organic cation transporter -like [Paramuricea clavata]|uniref:Organic cation transporter -like n=1 Tax=Paramuricea clavata TaxID=317549 RepID=A0A6S7HF94_PARCT|nr:organic cation transporter -like [Paramuricea clavata]